MKKTVLRLTLGILTLFLGSTFVQAQNKFGYIDLQALIQMMPEYQKANTDMDAYGKQLEDQLTKLQEEFQKNLDEYQKNQNTMPASIKELKEKDLRQMQERIQQFQVSAKQDLGQKEQELLKPIIEKAKNAIATVAKENGYTYIFDTSPGSPIIFKPEGDNIMGAVKKKLGISDEPVHTNSPVAPAKDNTPKVQPKK